MAVCKFNFPSFSGVNLLEDYADKKWGGNEKYETYKRNTPVLFPFFK